MIKGIYWKVGVWAYHPVFVQEDESGVKVVLWYSSNKCWSITTSEEMQFGSGWQSNTLAVGRTTGYEYDMKELQWTLLWNEEPDNNTRPRITASRYISTLKDELVVAYSCSSDQDADQPAHVETDAHICFGISFLVD